MLASLAVTIGNWISLVLSFVVHRTHAEIPLFVDGDAGRHLFLRGPSWPWSQLSPELLVDSGLSSALNIILKGGGGWIGGVAFQTQKAERERSTDSVCVESFSSILWFLISDWFFFLGGGLQQQEDHLCIQNSCWNLPLFITSVLYFFNPSTRAVIESADFFWYVLVHTTIGRYRGVNYIV